jgi:hypothetical protein
MSISFSTTAYVKGKPKSHRSYRSPRRHFRGRERAAVIRAFTAARLYLSGTSPTLVAAATACGSCPQYVRAAVTLIEAENAALVNCVLVGNVSLLEAARDAQRLAGLIKAYKTANAADHIAFARAIGPTNIFDSVVAPAI